MAQTTIKQRQISGGLDGWIPAEQSWAYASATTITVPSGAASKYQKGDKIKLTQTTAKYFYVVSVADTVLTVTGGSDYTVADAAITSPYFSKIENPQGFPVEFNWTPSYTGLTSTSTDYAVFSIVGNMVTYSLRGSGTVTGTPASLAFTAPVAAGSRDFPIGGGYVGSLMSRGYFSNTDDKVYLLNYDGSNFGGTASMRTSGFYRI